MIDVLVPILGRSPVEMLASLELSTVTAYRVFFLCSPNDPMVDVCRATGHTTWVMEWEPGRADFARKINWAYERTEQPWIFQGADDIRFSDNWDLEALDVARKTGARVIGTNDLHNPAVIAGQHATHLLFSRSYIEEFGGTLDRANPVFSEAYDHCYVDNEFIDLAKRRGQWAFAEKAVVEHLHPVWGFGEWDTTHEKAFKEIGQDRLIYLNRTRQFATR